MRRYLTIPVLILAAIAQTTLLPQIRIYDGQPDLPFLLVLAWALDAELEEAAAWAFVGGMLQDLLSAAPLGTSVIGLLLVVFLIDWLREQVAGVGVIPLLGLVGFGTIAQKAIALILTGMGSNDLFYLLIYVLLPTLAYNVILLAPVIWIARRVRGRKRRVDRFPRF